MEYIVIAISKFQKIEAGFCLYIYYTNLSNHTKSADPIPKN